MPDLTRKKSIDKKSGLLTKCALSWTQILIPSKEIDISLAVQNLKNNFQSTHRIYICDECQTQYKTILFTIFHINFFFVISPASLAQCRRAPYACRPFFFLSAFEVRQDHHTSRDNMAENLPPPNSTANHYPKMLFESFCSTRYSASNHRLHAHTQTLTRPNE